VLELYPALAAGGPTAITNGTGHLGNVTGRDNESRVCGDPKRGQEGYQGTRRRDPADLSPMAPNVAARCTAPIVTGSNVRGSAHVPGGDPVSESGGGAPYPRVATSNLMVGRDLQGPTLSGAQSWKAILTDALH
jgi:phospholipid/cholesterol/gamma-HCH transport system substrate-binding protein